MAEYESPITIVQKEMQNQLNIQMENSVIKAVREFGVDVDKEELIKALQYDRNQYSKGYNDAKAEIVHCSECKYQGIIHNHEYCKLLGGMSRRGQGNWFCADGERKE